MARQVWLPSARCLLDVSGNALLWGSRVRILYHHRIRSRDGQTVHLEELVGALRDLGHEVLLVGPKGFDQAAFGHDPKLLHWIKRALPASIYELLEIGYNIPAYMRLWRASRKFRPDFVYERYNLYLLAGIWLRRSVGLPILLEVNAPLAQERSSFGGLGLRRVGKATLERWVWRKCRCVVLPGYRGPCAGHRACRVCHASASA